MLGIASKYNLKNPITMRQHQVHDHPVLLFDGVCNLCNTSVQKVIKVDRKEVFRFASLQSDAARELLSNSQLSETHLDSVVLYKGGKFYSHSDAVLETARIMGFPWALLYIFRPVPRFIRDGVYNWIARNRYRWFGKKDQCMIPTPDLKARFLD